MSNRKQRKAKRWFLKICALALLAVGAYVLIVADSGYGEQVLRTARAETAADPLHLSTREPSDTAPEGFPMFTRLVGTTEMADTQYLKLVNRDRGIAVPVCPARLVTVWPDMPARTSYETLHETAFSAIRDLLNAAGNANIGSLFIASGFRSHDTQTELYTNAVNRAYVMPPGHSEHQLGLAADILSGNDTGSMRGSEEARWLAEHAPAFGLILRYPEDKQEITGVPYEPWHFRYVGRIHAWYMGQRNFVLEEYIAYLQANGGFRAEFDGRSYYVLYQRPENGMILIPEDMNFRVSSANTGGYVVTAWR